MVDSKEKFCVIGGGAVGLAMGKCFTQHGVPFDIIEREDDFGGNWYYGKPSGNVYESTHLISSKLNTQFSDFPMPEDYPDYPDHRLFLAYLRNLARHFNLYEHVVFNTCVTRITPSGPYWDVERSDGKKLPYRAVIVGNGRLREPKNPDYPGRFEGESLHSQAYRKADMFRGKRVLIVGAGNSGCDIAVDAVHYAAHTFHSTRRGYHYMPKYVHGKPTQDWMMEAASRFNSTDEFWEHAQQLFKMVGCDGEDYGLPRPDHKMYEAHPIMNSQILYHIGHGDILPKPDIRELKGRCVVFQDGSEEPIDVIVYATGYNLSFPFIDEQYMNVKAGMPELFMYTFHRTFHNLFFGGYFNAPSGLGNIANALGNTLIAYIKAWEQNSSAFQVFCKLKLGPNPDLGQGAYYKAERHAYELDVWKLLKAFQLLQAKFG